MGLDNIFLFVFLGLTAVMAHRTVNSPPDPVFVCLARHTNRAYHCYKSVLHDDSRHRGSPVGQALRQLLPMDYTSWASKKPAQRARKCITALKNFVEPLKAVIESGTGSDYFKRTCTQTNSTLGKTLTGLLHVLGNTINDINRYVKRKGIQVNNLHLKSVNMTPMALLATQSNLNGIQAIHRRNVVLLDMLDQTTSDIHSEPGSCFNNNVQMVHGCD